MVEGCPSDDWLGRLNRVESILQIQQLAVRYALAVDRRDIESWLQLFVEDVDCGRFGIGREALRGFIVPTLSNFYRSIHFVCGHQIDFEQPDRARGHVYCRAEHEDGEKWVIMAICYEDRYERRNGQWYFVRRRERHWYAADVLERPMASELCVWPLAGGVPPSLPDTFNTWGPFWNALDPQKVGSVTNRAIGPGTSRTDSESSAG